jgi:hypothetical protein
MYVFDVCLMLNVPGVHFDTSMSSLVTEITTAIKVYAYGVEDFVNDPKNANLSLNTQLSCEGIGDSRWTVGDTFFRYVIVTIFLRILVAFLISHSTVLIR